jgi:hypothetical protein
MLLSKPSSTIGTNIFGEIWTTHRSLGSSSTSSKGQIPWFHTPKFSQGLEADLDKHRRTTSMFQHATKYSVQMTNIMFKLSYLEIKNKHIIEKKDKSI